MLLDDNQISYALWECEEADRTIGYEEVWQPVDAPKWIAKAQLKKVMEYVENDPAEVYIKKARLLYKLSQALLDEVKE